MRIIRQPWYDLARYSVNISRNVGAMDETNVEQKLEDLRTEHRDLDEVINRLADEVDTDDSQIHRLKKRKLALKDQIIRLEEHSGNEAA